MLILTSRFVLPIYLIPIFYYFMKFFFISTLVLAVFLMICTSASSWKIQRSAVAAFKFKGTANYELWAYLDGQSSADKKSATGGPDCGFNCHNNINHRHPYHFTNTWVSFIEGNAYAVRNIVETHGYTILNEVKTFLS